MVTGQRGIVGDVELDPGETATLSYTLERKDYVSLIQFATNTFPDVEASVKIVRAGARSGTERLVEAMEMVDGDGTLLSNVETDKFLIPSTTRKILLEKDAGPKDELIIELEHVQRSGNANTAIVSVDAGAAATLEGARR